MTDEAPGARLWRWLLTPRDAAGVAAVRIGLGLLVAISAQRFLWYGWIDKLFVEPRFAFKYWGFGWVPSPSALGMRAVFVALTVTGLLVAVGLFYRAAIVALALLFAYVQLVDVSTYLNHYYLVTLLAALMSFIPAHRCWSVDARRNPSLRSDTLPAWCSVLLRFQVGVVYVNAGFAKLTSDWLLHAQPLQIWLSARTSLPLIGRWLDQPAMAYAAAWAGFLFDTTIVLWLLWRRTRPFAYAAVIAFHAATWFLFPIGMFPFIMTTAALVFFDPSWPRALLARIARRAIEPVGIPAPPLPSRRARAAFVVGAAYAALQLLMPLRAHLYGGHVLWHEQGMRFSWRVMAREKNGSVTFVVLDPRTGREWHVSPRRYLTSLQEREMAVQPDLILQLAHRIARDFTIRAGGPVQVRADTAVSWNGRPSVPIVDPTVDLARQVDDLSPKPWILPAPRTSPLRMRPLLARTP